MNTNYQLIFDENRNTWVAVSEVAARKGKKSAGKAVKGILASVALVSVQLMTPSVVLAQTNNCVTTNAGELKSGGLVLLKM